MKLLVAALALSLAGGTIWAQSEKKVVIPLAPLPGDKKAEAPKAAPAKSTPAAKKEAAPAAPKQADAGKEKEAPPPPMEGVIVSRGAKGYLGVLVSNGTFVVKFYDDKKKAKDPDVGQIALRWQPRNRNVIERALLGPSGGKSLGSSKTVLPPLNFRLNLTLLGADGAETGENYAVDFTQ